MVASANYGFLRIDTRSVPFQTQGVAATGGRLSPSVARSLDAGEAADLVELARALPDGWVVMVTPPHGQLVMLPRRYAHAHHRCYVADRELACVYRANGMHGVRVPAV